MFKLPKFLKDNSGAIAVETALVTPFLVFALLRATDVALQVHTGQQMSKATKSGIQYVVNGGRDEVSIRGVVQDSFSQDIKESDLLITAYCGCISENPGPEGGEATDNEVGGTYVKFQTPISDNMCVAACDSGSQISALIEIDFSHNISGIMTKPKMRTRLQTRVQ